MVNSPIPTARMAVSLCGPVPLWSGGCWWGASPLGLATGAGKCPARAVATMVRSGLGDTAAITPWDKHMATGSHVPAAEHWATATWLAGRLEHWQICHSYHGDADWGLMGCWYHLRLWLCCGVKVGVVTHGCSSWDLALRLKFKPTSDGGFPWMWWLCRAVQWVVCSAMVLGKGTCHLPCCCSCWSLTLPSWCLGVSGESWTGPGRNWNAFVFVILVYFFLLVSFVWKVVPNHCSQQLLESVKGHWPHWDYQFPIPSMVALV